MDALTGRFQRSQVAGRKEAAGSESAATTKRQQGEGALLVV